MIEEKMKKCCRKPFSLIFVDQNMPVMDGMNVNITDKVIDDEVNKDKDGR